MLKNSVLQLLKQLIFTKLPSNFRLFMEQDRLVTVTKAAFYLMVLCRELPAALAQEWMDK